MKPTQLPQPWAEALVTRANAAISPHLSAALLAAISEAPLPDAAHATFEANAPDEWLQQTVAATLHALGARLHDNTPAASPTASSPPRPGAPAAPLPSPAAWPPSSTSAPSAPSALALEPAAPIAAPEAPQAEPTATAIPPQSLASALFDLQKFANWGASGAEPLVEAQRRFAQWFPEYLDRAEAAIAAGRALKVRQDDLARRLCRYGTEHTATLQAFDHFVTEHPYLRNWANKQYERQRSRQSRPPASTGSTPDGPLSVVEARGEHAIWRLPPAPSYTLLIDETGDDFAAVAAQNTRRGRFVGLVYPDHAPPPALLNFHATERTPNEIDAALQALLDHNLGVIGVTVDGLPPTAGDRWRSGVLEIIEWTLRLLPADAPTQLTVQVENRADNMPGDKWQAAADALRRNLVERDPARAAHLSTIRIEIVGKAHPYLPYADVLAYTWGTAGTKNQHSRARLQQSHLRPLLLTQGPDLRRTYDLLQSVDRLPGLVPSASIEAWWLWLAHPASQHDNSLQTHGLSHVASAIERNPALWTTLLSRVHTQLDGPDLDLHHVGTALGWLEARRPPDATLPPRHAFLWTLAQLVEGAHHGHLDDEALEAELTRLGARLIDEDARLVCLADLYRAVSATNACDFQSARGRLHQWIKAPMAVPGRRLYGRVLSSLGQHEAFEGRLAEALQCFDGALQVFNDLTDKVERERELVQTRTYRAIVLIDQLPLEGKPRPESLQSAVEAAEAIVGPLPAAAERLNPTANPRDKYAHHLLWRLAATGHAPALTSALLEGQKLWKTGQGHPWPLIEFYRALALRNLDPEAAADRALKAIELAFAEEGSPTTVHLIGAAIATAARALGAGHEHLEAWLTLLEATLPRAAAIIATLRALEAQTSPPEPMRVLSAALPFNFK